MEAQRSRENRWLPTSWGFPHFIAILAAIIVILTLWWLFGSPGDCPNECSRISLILGGCKCVEEPHADRPLAETVTECQRQLADHAFSIPAKTAHERYLVDLRTTPPKNPIYFYVEILRHSYGPTYGVRSSTPASLGNVVVLVHRPNDADHLRNLETPCYGLQDSSIKSTDGTGSENKRWVEYCDLTRFQNERQEAESGVLKYRVIIQNRSDEPLDYCFVASCDARYPAGRRCDLPPPGQGQGQSASYSPP